MRLWYVNWGPQLGLTLRFTDAALKKLDKSQEGLKMAENSSLVFFFEQGIENAFSLFHLRVWFITSSNPIHYLNFPYVYVHGCAMIINMLRNTLYNILENKNGSSCELLGVSLEEMK